MANQTLSVTVNGTTKAPSATASAIGISTSLIRSIEPYVVPAAGQPISGVTILTVIKMQRQWGETSEKIWLSPTATATVVTAAI